jgi:hypothetical protein
MQDVTPFALRLATQIEKADGPTGPRAQRVDPCRRRRVVRLSAAVGTGATTAVQAHLIRSCRLKRRWLADQTRSSAPRLRLIVRVNTPSSFVSRSGASGVHTFFRSTSSR